MSKKSNASAIRLQGVRHNNLKNFDLDLPLGKLIVISGLSGSGKSSLAFDVLYAEGQRRYIETFSPYARQFFDRMDKPQVRQILGIPPAIAIEQRNTVKSTRSTVGTMTEICDYMKTVWPHLAQLHCRQCGTPIRKDSPGSVWRSLMAGAAAAGAEEGEAVVIFNLELSDKLSLDESLALVVKQGFQRLLIENDSGSGSAHAILRIEEAPARFLGSPPRRLTLVQDRLKLSETHRQRFVEACEQAYHFGKGKLGVYFPQTGGTRHFSDQLHCPACDLHYREATPALFSFNHPLGACPTCRGFGRTIAIDYDLAIPDRSLSLAGGVVKPWQSGVSAECQADLMKFCRKRSVPTNVPFHELPAKIQDWVLNGDPDYGKDKDHQWPRAWYGVKGYFRWLESKAYKMHVRVLLSRYRSYQTCRDCQGARLQPEALLHTIQDGNGRRLNLSDFYRLPAREAFRVVDNISSGLPARNKSDPMRLALEEVCSRLRFLVEIGLGYLTLDRPTRTLSGGETERVNLTTCLGSRLVNTLFVLDEPSVGLHPRDTDRLVLLLQRLRDAGNTVVVVEHEARVIQAADHIVDLGPGHGEKGGEIIYAGPCRNLLKSRSSLTGQYLSGRKSNPVPARRPVHAKDPTMMLEGARLHNLRNLTVRIPLGRFVCVTGVSGSGKTTLVRSVLLPRLQERFERKVSTPASGAGRTDEELSIPQADTGHRAVKLSGHECLGTVVMVDQSPIGKTPRSNPAVYVGAFDHLRDLFAQSEPARQRGLKSSSFSFNSRDGQCELCRGAGFEKIEMQFLSDVFIRCPACAGRRFREHVLEARLLPPVPPDSVESPKAARGRRPNDFPQTPWSIADFLEATIDEASEFLEAFGKNRSAQRAREKLGLLQEVGLGYLRLGQPINTLSGGESQRLKLVSHLAEFGDRSKPGRAPTLFLFDEPTTGLHFHDVGVILQVFQRLVQMGHSIVVIEHNLDVIKSADWIIDLGPEAGEEGGRLVAEGTPEAIALSRESHTGRALAALTEFQREKGGPPVED